jgi:RNA polymerase sigma-70 factor (sigma-E family)
MMAAVEVEAEPQLADLYREHYRSLVRLASLLLDDVGASEEVVQDAFVSVHRAWDRIDDPARRVAYLRSTVLNGARSGLRRRRVRRRYDHVEVAGPTEGAESGALLAEEHREVLAALRDLPRRQRECLVLRYYLDLSEADIATTLGISAGSVKTHAHRGLAALAVALKEDT